MDTALIQTLKKILKQFPKFWNGENLQRSLVVDAIQKKEVDLVKALINNSKIKSIYSTDVDGILIFDFDKLISLLKYKEYWADSFTKYRNEVGLTSEGKYLDYSSDVVLDFPFKDCVLEGGMTKEDQEKAEVYYNEVIARDEIDRLFSPKVFTNTKFYTKDGVEEKFSQLKDEDNLIIKGNNLIALHSLKERYAGKVKLIYIDPPYNTGGDNFKYNDRFNHSTWLVFMKNRLEIARDLLSENGTLWISIDSNESHYLKVLTDKVFGRNNFIEEVIWQRSYSPINLKKTFSRSHDTIFVYAKNLTKSFELNKLARDESATNRYSNPDKDPRGDWQSDNFSVGPAVEANIYEVITPNGRSVFPPSGRSWVLSKKRFLEFLEDNRIWFGKDGGNVPRIKRFLSEVKDGVVAQSLWTYQEVGHNQDAKRELKEIFNKDIFATPKPEKLIQRIITLGSNENDLVLDFHVGSGTTCAVAHKMGRRYIGIEQMDYINELTVPRLQKVIDGEQGGISRDVNWEGGGSFVYTELMELNYIFIHQIEQAETPENLRQLFDVMKAEAHLNYQIALDKVLSNEYELNGVNHFVSFSDLELPQQKQLLIDVLDKNQLYVNFSEMDDCNLAISDIDKAFTTSFYQGGE